MFSNSTLFCIFRNFRHAARVSEFRTEFNGLRTGETSDPFGVQLCIIQVSNGPLLETVFIDASAQNFTARGTRVRHCAFVC